MSGLSPEEFLSLQQSSFSTSCWRALAHRLPDCLIPGWRWRTRITGAVCRSKHRTSLRKWLSRGILFAAKLLQKLGAAFPGAVVTVSKPFAKPVFHSKAQVFQELLLIFEFFQQTAEENMCPLIQVFTWWGDRDPSAYQLWGSSYPKPLSPQLPENPGSWSEHPWATSSVGHWGAWQVTVARIFILFSRDFQHSQNYQIHLPIPLFQS